jgi:hypothetical protein
LRLADAMPSGNPYVNGEVEQTIFALPLALTVAVL